MQQPDSTRAPTDSTKVCGMVAAEKMGDDGYRGQNPTWRIIPGLVSKRLRTSMYRP